MWAALYRSHVAHLLGLCAQRTRPRFVGPFSLITAPLSFNKESVYFVASFGAGAHFSNYSLMFPTRCLKRADAIYFEGYPEFHCFPFIRDRLFALNPAFKFVFFVREPCSKVISQWCQLQDTAALGDALLNERFADSLAAIGSDKYEALYRFFVGLDVEDSPPTETHQIEVWPC